MVALWTDLLIKVRLLGPRYKGGSGKQLAIKISELRICLQSKNKNKVEMGAFVLVFFFSHRTVRIMNHHSLRSKGKLSKQSEMGILVAYAHFAR